MQAAPAESSRTLQELVQEAFPEGPRYQPAPQSVSSYLRHEERAEQVAEAPQLATRIPAPMPPSRNPAGDEFRFSNLRYVGQVLNCYLVCELNERLVVVDMHAAHERVNYNRIRKARAEQKLTVQKLLIPEGVRLTAEHVAALMDQEEALAALAFEVRQTGLDTIEILGVPAIISHLRCGALLKELAAEPVIEGWRERLEERIDHMAARIACHASVRSGDTMSRAEAYSLFAQMDEADISGACPHGRPVVAEFGRDAVERWFGRDR